jgi:23S rRNA (pseudouridine1915-N3)-methyltransferase
MRLMVATVGRLKAGPERDIFLRYADRFAALGKRIGFAPVTWAEIAEGRVANPTRRCAEEGEALLKLARDADFIVALDERGKAVSSEAFARALALARDGGHKALAILIGGPDGHSAAVRKAAQMQLSLSTMTLPHGLARIILAEQLYRAATILSGHPYHRG